MTLRSMSWKKKGEKKIFFFSVIALFYCAGMKTEAHFPMIKAYSFENQTLSSRGGKITVHFRIKGRNESQSYKGILKGIYKKGRQKSNSSRKEKFLIVWKEALVKREQSFSRSMQVEKLYSEVKSSFIPRGTELEVKGDLHTFFLKIQEIYKKDWLLSHKSPSLEDKKKGMFSEKISSVEKSFTKGNYNSEEKRYLGQEGFSLQPFQKKKKKQKKVKGSFSENSLGFIPENLEIDILKEGCSVRIDKKQESAIIQTRSIIRKNGKIYKEEPCSDSNERYPLKKHYEECPDYILKEEGRVHPQYKHYWVDDKGEVHRVDEICKPDEDITFEILEEEDACDLDVDLKKMTAHQMATLIYKDYRKRRIVIEECRPHSKKEELRLEKIFCGYHHNFEEKKSIPQTRIVTFIKGHERRITPCRDDGEALPHQGSTLGCPPIVDPQSGKRFVQVRVMIESREGPLFLTRCRPSQELEETTEGCSQKFDHNFETGQSKGYSRFFYKSGDQRIFVTDCEPSEHVFLHHTRLIGYVHNDETKSSQPQIEIYIDVPYAGSVVIKNSKEQEASLPSIAYTPEDIQVLADEENAFYEGCFKIVPQHEVQIYRRPDGTFFKEIIGKALPEKSKNLCKVYEEMHEHKSSSWYMKSGNRPTEDIHWPSGSFDGEWLGCGEARQKAPWGSSGLPFFLYHSSFLEKRLRTELPSGDVSFSSWEKMSPVQNIRTQIC
ncbi:MAG: hypothetical protein JSS34_00255 [Proteobacteria bacterium]|nr:hypothetical protein [Pseudomonadota bacterium]